MQEDVHYYLISRQFGLANPDCQELGVMANLREKISPWQYSRHSIDGFRGIVR